jgi:hypothetical protein
LDIYWLIGAIIGSGLFIFVGGPPARRLLEVARACAERGARR